MSEEESLVRFGTIMLGIPFMMRAITFGYCGVDPRGWLSALPSNYKDYAARAVDKTFREHLGQKMTPSMRQAFVDGVHSKLIADIEREP